MQGSVHHYIGLIECADGDKLGFLQMYIYDIKREVHNRSISQLGVVLNAEVIQELQDELDEYNAHVQMFQSS